MLTQKEMEEVLKQAKKTLSEEELKETLKKCSYGGEPVNMSMRGGEEFEGSYKDNNVRI